VTHEDSSPPGNVPEPLALDALWDGVVVPPGDPAICANAADESANKAAAARSLALMGDSSCSV